MQPGIESLLKRRRDRAIAVILGIKERDIDPHVPHESAQKLRKVVLDQINDLHEVVVDVIESLDSGDVTLNEIWLQKLDDIHRATVNGAR